MFLTSFLFLDWKYLFLNLPYKFDVQLELNDQTNEKNFLKHLLNPLYILVVLFLSILLIPTVFLSVYWDPFITYLTQPNVSLGIIILFRKYYFNLISLANKYTFAYNLSTIAAILICPINGYLLGFRADKSKFEKKKKKN